MIIFNEGNPGRTALIAAASSTRRATRSSRRSRSRSRRSTPASASTPSTSSPGGGGGAARRSQHPGARQAERRRLQRHRRVQGRGPEPCPGRRCAPRRHLRRRDARQRLGLGDDPRHRPEDEQGQAAEQAAVHLVRRRGAGLLGSEYYVNNLEPDRAGPASATTSMRMSRRRRTTSSESSTRRPRTSSGERSATTFPPQVYEPSKVARDQAVAYFDSVGLNHEFFRPWAPTRSASMPPGIPASGLLTGQDCCKNQDEVNLFGGSLGNYEGNIPSFDGGCVDNPFLWCDNLTNNDPEVLTFMSRRSPTWSSGWPSTRASCGRTARRATRRRCRGRSGGQGGRSQASRHR